MRRPGGPMTCPLCQGPSHPSTGSYYGPRWLVCGPCVRDFWDWLRQRMRGRPRRDSRGVRGPSFYEHAGRIDR